MFTWIALAVTSILVGVGYYLFKVWANWDMKAKQLILLKYHAQNLVKSLEQRGKRFSWTGEDKKNLALGYMRDFTNEEDLIEMLIEAAVYDLEPEE